MQEKDSSFHFTYKNLAAQLSASIQEGYSFIRCKDNLVEKENLSPLTMVMRVDIDNSCKKADKLIDIFHQLGIKATFFIRLHASEYNPFSFENYRIIKRMIDEGHEIGYHSEIVDQAAIWQEDTEEVLKRDINVLNSMFNIEIEGAASHGGSTGLNNLDFFRGVDPKKYGLKYEAYDETEDFGLFNNSFYISDAEWVRWKCYENGNLDEGNHMTLGEHVKLRRPLIYFLIHSDTYFDDHIYE